MMFWLQFTITVALGFAIIACFLAIRAEIKVGKLNREIVILDQIVVRLGELLQEQIEDELRKELSG